MKSSVVVLLALGVGACSGQDRSHTATAPVDVVQAKVEAPRLVPKPGADLTGPVKLTSKSVRNARSVRVVDLDDDRALVKVNVPRLPRGASTRMTFDENKSGWVTRIPESRQLPAVAYGKGRVYVSGGFNSLSFYGLNAHSGRIEWATTHLEDNGPTAAVFEDDRVLFNTESCTIFALDAKTGKRIWHKWLGDPTLAQVAVADGIVYSAHPSVNGPVLSAFRTKNGKWVWTRYVGSELLATPVIAGDSVYASTIKGMTFRFNRKTGKRVWAKYLAATTAPWIVGDELFVTRRHKGAEQQAVVSAKTGKIVRSHSTTKALYLHDVPTNLKSWPKVWAFEGSRPIVSHGVRYVAMGGNVHATDAQTGAKLWVRRYAKGVGKRSVGSVALAGAQVVVSTRGGHIYGLDIDTGYTLWSYDLGRKVVAQPIIAKGWVYATTRDGYVIALRVGDKTLDGWHMFGGNAKHNGPV